MTLDPRSAREESPYVQCRLSNVVTWIDDATVVWHETSVCYGEKGIYPGWQGNTSLCKGPTECVLLKNRELFYPPCRNTWLSYLDSSYWDSMRVKFVQLSECNDSVSDDIKKHIETMQLKWGII